LPWSRCAVECDSATTARDLAFHRDPRPQHEIAALVLLRGTLRPYLLNYFLSLYKRTTHP
jgi:hypothetical protein